MSHTIRDKQKLKARASKIQGQVVALKKMLDDCKTAVFTRLQRVRWTLPSSSAIYHRNQTTRGALLREG